MLLLPTMIQFPSFRFLFVCTLLVCFTATAPAVAPAAPAPDATPYKPKLVNSKNQKFQDFPMGVLSATGRLNDGDRAILVQDVGKEGAAARGGLQVGDRILSINGKAPKPFTMKTDDGLNGPQRMLGLALNHACASKKPMLHLRVERKQEKMLLKIALPAAPAFSHAFPKNCKKSKAYLHAIADHLVATQRKNGRWRPGAGGDADVYCAAYCGLTLLAADDAKYLPAIKKSVDFVTNKSISLIDSKNPKIGPKSWMAASSAIFLAEYHLATGDESVLPDLYKCCDLLAARVSENGTMGHGFVVGYNGGGLVIINTQAHLAWALAEKCGYTIDNAAWDRSEKEVLASIDKKTGAIGYSSRAPWSPDIAARTGAMAAAFALSGKQPNYAKQFANALTEHSGRMRHAHAMSSIGTIYGLSGIKLVSRKQHRKVLNQWRPYLELCRTAEGPAAFFGSKRNYGGDMYLGLDPIGNAVAGLMLASGEEKLFMYGGKKKGWFGAK